MSIENHPENKVVITDTSCFILLEKIGALDVLHQVFAIIFTTPEIAAEYGHPLPGWGVTIKSADPSLKTAFNKYVDEGEASAIALASEIACDYLILNDAADRRLAIKLNMPVKGNSRCIINRQTKKASFLYFALTLASYNKPTLDCRKNSPTNL